MVSRSSWLTAVMAGVLEHPHQNGFSGKRHFIIGATVQDATPVPMFAPVDKAGRVHTRRMFLS